MSKINELEYFLNCVKDTLPFEDGADFKKKIRENKEFRIKVQKLVFISKFFGWENPYVFTLAERGPYSVELKQDYLKQDIFEGIPEKIDGLNKTRITEFFKGKSLLFYEAAATILYKLGPYSLKIDEDACISLISSLKQHIPRDIIKDAYVSIKDFGLCKRDIECSKEKIDKMEFEAISKIKDLTTCFEEYEGSNNKIIVLGSIDYMRIALRESDLNLRDKYELLLFIRRYLSIVEKLSLEVRPDQLINLNLDDLEELFDQFQDYVSGELNIIKRIDDDEFDESLCYW